MSPFSAIPAVWQTVIPLVLFCEAVLELGLLLYQLLHSRMPLRSLPCAVHLGILVTLLLSVTQGDPNAGKNTAAAKMSCLPSLLKRPLTSSLWVSALLTRTVA